jgi:hypothetical protein
MWRILTRARKWRREERPCRHKCSSPGVELGERVAATSSRWLEDLNGNILSVHFRAVHCFLGIASIILVPEFDDSGIWSVLRLGMDGCQCPVRPEYIVQLRVSVAHRKVFDEAG